MHESQAKNEFFPERSGVPGRCLHLVPLLFLVVGVLVVAEVLIMFVISHLPPMSVLATSLLDALLLAGITLPILYGILLAPLCQQIRHRLAAEQATREGKQFLSNVIDSLPYPFYVIDARDYTVKMANAAALAEGQENCGTCHALTHGQAGPCTGDDHPCPLQQVKATGKPVVLEHVHQNQAGESWVCEIHGYPVFDEAGEVAQMIEVSIDITERKKMETLLREQKRFTAKLMKYSAVPTFVIDNQHQVLFWNKACEALTGIKAVDIVGTKDHWRPFYPHPRPCLADLALDNAGLVSGALYEFIEQSRVLPHGLHAEGWFEHIGGQRRYLVFEAAPIFDDEGKTMAAIETLRDITVRKEIEEAFAFQATRDELTGIYNRRKLDELLKQEIERAQRYQTPFALIMFDLDYFKNINDTYGHDVGDAVLQKLAAVMREHIRVTDHLGRWGGEEFMLLAPETVLAQASFLAEKLRRQVEGHHFDQVRSITMSIGVGEYRVGEGVDSLIKRVDDALYGAKESGRNIVQLAE